MNKDQRLIAYADFLKELYPTHKDAARCFSSLSKLTRHLTEPVVITGSIASGWHLLNSGWQVKRKSLNDIDTVALTGLSQLSPSLTQDFLINHFHPSRERGKVLLQLVDEEHGTRIEVFTPQSNSLGERLTQCAIGDLPCRIISAEDALSKLLSIIHASSEGMPVDPKYVEQFDLLSQIANQERTQKVWRDYRKESQHLDFNEAAERAKACIAADPSLLQPTSYCQDVNYVCAWCQESELFPVASRSKIYEILGYV